MQKDSNRLLIIRSDIMRYHRLTKKTNPEMAKWFDKHRVDSINLVFTGNKVKIESLDCY